MNRKNFIKSSLLTLIGLPLLGKPETQDIPKPPMLEVLNTETGEWEDTGTFHNVRLYDYAKTDFKSKPLREGYQSLSVEFDKLTSFDMDKVKVIYEK